MRRTNPGGRAIKQREALQIGGFRAARAGLPLASHARGPLALLPRPTVPGPGAYRYQAAFPFAHVRRIAICTAASAGEIFADMRCACGSALFTCASMASSKYLLRPKTP